MTSQWSVPFSRALKFASCSFTLFIEGHDSMFPTIKQQEEINMDGLSNYLYEGAATKLWRRRRASSTPPGYLSRPSFGGRLLYERVSAVFLPILNKGFCLIRIAFHHCSCLTGPKMEATPLIRDPI